MISGGFMEITKVSDISILHLFGEVSFMEIDRIERVLGHLGRSLNNKVLIDMTWVDHVHYMVVKKLVRSATAFRRQRGDLKLVNVNPETRELIRFTGADQFLEDYATISEAILSFLKPADEQLRVYQ